LLFLLFLAALRFCNLQNDPPLFYTGHGQALLTDPYHLTFAARNKVLFGEWNPFDYHRWDVFRNSLVSGVGFLYFKLGGVSRITANLASLSLQMSGMLLFLLGFAGFRRYWEIVLTALLLLLNSTLFFYGRAPFLENGLIFLSGLTFFAFVRYHERLWGQFLVGVLVACAAMAGKLFGVCLFGPVVLTTAYVYRRRSFVPLAAATGGFLAGIAAYLFLFYGGELSSVVEYYRQHTVGLYGGPPGFASAAGFFHMLITFGGESGLWQYTPFITLMAELAALLVVANYANFMAFKREYIPLVFCAGWVLCGVFVIMPFFYRPLRYGLFLFLPLAALIAYGVEAARTEVKEGKRHAIWIIPGGFAFVFWHLFTQVQMYFSTEGQKSKAGWEALPTTAVLAILAAVMMYVLLKKASRTFRIVVTGVFAMLLVASVTYQGTLLAKGLLRPGAHLRSYNRQLAEILPEEAVLTGPYMPALTIDNRLRGVIYSFALSDHHEEFFQRFPVSHLVTEHNDWEEAVKEYPALSGSTRLAQVMVRERVIGIYRLPDADLPLTEYEQGVLFFNTGRADSALVYLQHFRQTYPDNLIGGMALINTWFAAGKIDSAATILEGYLQKQPDHYFLHAFARSAYRNFYQATQKPDYRAKAEYHEQRAQELNPAMKKSK
jgi:hypothetical protein